MLGPGHWSPYSWVYTQNRHTSTPSMRWNSRMTCGMVVSQRQAEGKGGAVNRTKLEASPSLQAEAWARGLHA